MSKFLNCTACVLAKRGVRTRQAVPHTCARGNRDYIEPEIRIGLDGKKVYQIFYHSVKLSTYGSTLYKLKPQYLNGFKVKAYTELWVPHFMSQGCDNAGENKKWVWVTEDFYLKLSFVQYL